MTEQEIQEAIAAIYDASADELPEDDDDYLVRRNLMNRAVRRWSRDKGYYWNELRLTATGTITTSNADYTVDDDTFARPMGNVKIINSAGQTYRKYPVLNANDANQKRDTATYAYFDGNKVDGYVMHINPMPEPGIVGMTYRYQYIKTATLFAAPGDVSEIPDEEYLIHSAVAELYKQDNNFSAYQSSLSEAEERLKGMEVDYVSGASWEDDSYQDEPGFGV